MRLWPPSLEGEHGWAHLNTVLGKGEVSVSPLVWLLLRAQPPQSHGDGVAPAAALGARRKRRSGCWDNLRLGKAAKSSLEML